jgi:hypothetical protein
MPGRVSGPSAVQHNSQLLQLPKPLTQQQPELVSTALLKGLGPCGCKGLQATAAAAFTNELDGYSSIGGCTTQVTGARKDLHTKP